jgi:O-antigen ligase
MAPSLATLIFFVGVVGLFLFARDREARTSLALWIPVAWLAIGGSRNVSVWLGAGGPVSADQYLEGSPLDRNLLSGLIALGVVVLMVRGRQTLELLRKNLPLVVFFLYCAASILWSDFPFVALKRWMKVAGNVVMVLVILTEEDPAAAFKQFLVWTAFILVPSSILLIKYHPEMGRYYDQWEGTLYNSGVTTDKNLLGVICLVLGFGVLSRFVDTLRVPGPAARRLVAVGVVFAMDIWLLVIAHSATSLVCFLLGATLIVLFVYIGRGKSWFVHVTVASLAIVGLGAYFLPPVRAFFIESAGRDATLTGRTELWGDVLRMDTHPWFGAGFESFFLGPRLEFLWEKYWWHPNEAHNGYLETYLTLGAIGLSLIGLLLVTGYRNAIRIYRNDPVSGSLRLAFLIIAPIYNMTEAAFKVMNPMWILFLAAVTALPALLPEKAASEEPVLAKNRPVSPWMDQPRSVSAGSRDFSTPPARRAPDDRGWPRPVSVGGGGPPQKYR